MDAKGSVKLWVIWGVGTAVVSAVLVAGLLFADATRHPALAEVRSVFAPGTMLSGHHQIELACDTCHTDPFGKGEVLQQACVRCHGQQLADADDKHPLSKFTDPRNAELLSKLDARACVTCHVEHRPQISLTAGVTQPADFCWNCHRDIAVDRPSHQGMKFDTCASSGCHNFHDNRALYEDFLLKHAEEPAKKARMQLPTTNFLQTIEWLPDYPSKHYPLTKLSAAQADAPGMTQGKTQSKTQSQAHEEWLASSHARAGVNCSGCHQPRQMSHQRSDATDLKWTDRPDQQVCSSCHSLQVHGFLSGKHGMRVQEGLPAMQPARARLEFKKDAAHRDLNCVSCHAAHSFDRGFAAVQACVRCHDDRHSKAYEQSPHADLWRRELAGESARGSGVSCASCHLPRVEHRYEEYEVTQVFAQHNQNDTLRPNSKMIRPVCMHCHGLAFAIDALADVDLIRRNFIGQPARRVQSIDMALTRINSQASHKELKESSPAVLTKH